MSTAHRCYGIILFSLTLIVQVATTRSGDAAAPDDSKPLEWRALLIVKAKGHVKAQGFAEVEYEMTQTDIAAVKAAFVEHTGSFVKSLSRGRLAWKPEVVVSSAPLKAVSKLGDGNWVSAECVASDIDKHVAAGKYDGVFVYWKDTDDATKQGLKGGFGWTIGPTDAAKGCGYSCINFVPARDLTRDSEWTEVFLHEWLHQLEAFYGSKGVRLPRGGLHGNDNYGFKHLRGWKHWYEAFINADLKEKDGTRVGLGESAWRLGTIRDETAIRLPEYLTSARRHNNLLADGSFEQAPTKGWAPRSWRSNRAAAAVTTDSAKSGKAAVALQAATDADDVMFGQKVSVKPRTRYLLSGWIKTKDIAVQSGGKTGANLSIWGGFEASRSLVGTCDWTYLALVFNSGDRKEIEVGPRLGHHGSTATGTAWFDDLCLIELPDTASDTR